MGKRLLQRLQRYEGQPGRSAQAAEPARWPSQGTPLAFLSERSAKPDSAITRPVTASGEHGEHQE